MGQRPHRGGPQCTSYAPCRVSGKEYEYRAVLLKAGKVQVEHYERDLLLQVATAPFAQGGLRQAFWARQASWTGSGGKRAVVGLPTRLALYPALI